MREIKFRAWDRKNKKWVSMDDRIKIVPDDEEDFTWSFIIAHSPSDNTLLLLGDMGFDIVQFTGLKDKNGKEIYEGDIVRDCNGLNTTWVVEWCDSEAGFLGLDWCGNKNEVIGNIYENPELLSPKPGVEK